MSTRPARGGRVFSEVWEWDGNVDRLLTAVLEALRAGGGRTVRIKARLSGLYGHAELDLDSVASARSYFQPRSAPPETFSLWSEDHDPKRPGISVDAEWSSSIDAGRASVGVVSPDDAVSEQVFDAFIEIAKPTAKHAPVAESAVVQRPKQRNALIAWIENHPATASGVIGLFAIAATVVAAIVGR